MFASRRTSAASTATVRASLVAVAAILFLGSCTGQSEPFEPEPSEPEPPTTQATAATWSTDDFNDLVAYCESVFDEPIADCEVVVRDFRDTHECPADGTYDVLDELERLFALDADFKSEVHSSSEARDWPLQMQSELDEATTLAGCKGRLVLNW